MMLLPLLCVPCLMYLYFLFLFFFLFPVKVFLFVFRDISVNGMTIPANVNINPVMVEILSVSPYFQLFSDKLFYCSLI
jgi:hypothetical protein